MKHLGIGIQRARSGDRRDLNGTPHLTSPVGRGIPIGDPLTRTPRPFEGQSSPEPRVGNGLDRSDPKQADGSRPVPTKAMQKDRRPGRFRGLFGIPIQAGGKGFEPLQTDSESAVLPLDEPPIYGGRDLLNPYMRR